MTWTRTTRPANTAAVPRARPVRAASWTTCPCTGCRPAARTARAPEQLPESRTCPTTPLRTPNSRPTANVRPADGRPQCSPFRSRHNSRWTTRTVLYNSRPSIIIFYQIVLILFVCLLLFFFFLKNTRKVFDDYCFSHPSIEIYSSLS